MLLTNTWIVTERIHVFSVTVKAVINLHTNVTDKYMNSYWTDSRI